MGTSVYARVQAWSGRAQQPSHARRQGDSASSKAVACERYVERKHQGASHRPLYSIKMEKLGIVLEVIQGGMLKSNPASVKSSVAEAAEVLDCLRNTYKCLMHICVGIQKGLESHPAWTFFDGLTLNAVSQKRCFINVALSCKNTVKPICMIFHLLYKIQFSMP